LTRLPLGEPVEPAEPPDEPEPVIDGTEVTLRRPHPDDAPALFAATHGDEEREAVWTYMGYGPWPDAGEMAQWIGSTVQSQDPMWWTVDAGSGPVGMAVLLNRDPLDRRIEIGHIGYAPSVQRTTVNTERRVEWKCDALNERSRVAALRLGFTFEGVFRNHMIVKGRNRDSAWFAMTDAEGPPTCARLEEWLYQTPPGSRDAGAVACRGWVAGGTTPGPPNPPPRPHFADIAARWPRTRHCT
jgi:RimJ/RimL family protein N-acetyltransferase